MRHGRGQGEAMNRVLMKESKHKIRSCLGHVGRQDHLALNYLLKKTLHPDRGHTHMHMKMRKRELKSSQTAREKQEKIMKSRRKLERKKNKNDRHICLNVHSTPRKTRTYTGDSKGKEPESMAKRTTPRLHEVALCPS